MKISPMFAATIASLGFCALDANAQSVATVRFVASSNVRQTSYADDVEIVDDAAADANDADDASPTAPRLQDYLDAQKKKEGEASPSDVRPTFPMPAPSPGTDDSLTPPVAGPAPSTLEEYRPASPAAPATPHIPSRTYQQSAPAPAVSNGDYTSPSCGFVSTSGSYCSDGGCSSGCCSSGCGSSSFFSRCRPGRGLLNSLLSRCSHSGCDSGCSGCCSTPSCGCNATCGCEPACGCEATCGCQPVCGCNAAPTCGCEPACGCEPICGCNAGPTCGCEPICGCQPVCGCNAAPTCGCQPSCGCDNGCCGAGHRKFKLFGSFKGWLHRSRSCCDSGCSSCDASCGVNYSPACGMNYSPSCGISVPASSSYAPADHVFTPSERNMLGSSVMQPEAVSYPRVHGVPNEDQPGRIVDPSNSLEAIPTPAADDSADIPGLRWYSVR